MGVVRELGRLKIMLRLDSKLRFSIEGVMGLASEAQQTPNTHHCPTDRPFQARVPSVPNDNVKLLSPPVNR